jgi:hypothetical protein
MQNISEPYLSKIRRNKIPNLDLGDDIHPAYDGLSLVNLPASVCSWLDAPELPYPTLQIPELNAIMDGIDQIIVVLIDALSFSRFMDWTSILDFDIPFEVGSLFPMTSVVPSTTSSALTTLWTGRSPAEHGILGYELFLREYGLIANMITHSPAALAKSPGLLYQAGFNPEEALPVTNLGPHLAEAGVETFAILSRTIMYSGLSRMHYPNVDLYGFTTVSDLWHIARQLANLPLKARRLVWVYYGAIDTLSHKYGPDSEQAQTEFLSFLRAMCDIFVSGISDDARGRSALLLVSDHGQKATSQNPHFELSSHPSFTNRLHMLPTGEHRFSYLHIRPGQREAILEYIERTWPRSFYHLNAHHALEVGLFGPGEPARESHHRIGDQIIISKNDNYFWWDPAPNTLRGRHGGLSFDEMVVPLFALPLKK